MIIGLVGTIAAGKGEVASYLKRKGFEYYTFSDIIREEAKKRSLPQSREGLQHVGNLLRREYDDQGVIAKRLLKKIKSDKAVLDGVRNRIELAELRKAPSFYLIAVDAPQKLRFERLKARKRKGDPVTFEAFKKIDDAENEGASKGQEIRACIREADFTVDNSGTMDELHQKIDRILLKLGTS